ncbi:MAG: Single-stranded-DNA-specific exonuclease RecJ [Candidatus Kaiserbacteria bacterium GW2011_GWC2_52_8b]|uniref:Single-stranded-DNA-specific exonuclease RecJ n=1 Tax=Candidatus Kaiserbacteria bacterium GW2011_GWC2_52_8b TaxID=1618676 RepID=A0A0G1XHC9_9BACT|nr:MAG: Single-stranded-DNA-specific exonuclease RecJ [Candidatus Kaiserbacteria bacterium GW2011_GWC2_52_8b]
MEVSDFVRELLTKRGISTDTDVHAFLNPDYELHTHSPMLIEGMNSALERLFCALERNERIAVYADFDCDGIPGASILSDFFKKIGYENFEIYIPHRDREGYGFHEEAITLLASHGVKLIITVDVGMTAVDAVAHARAIGVDVIVTDHHEIMGELSAGRHGMPEAIAVLNPKLGDYPFRDLCGAAMAFKLAQAALIEGKRRGIVRFISVPDGWEKWLLDCVAIATIADMVPLALENRTLVRYGLSVLRKSPRPGIRALCTRLRLKQSELTEDDIGFSIGPRINAASRMGEPEIALRLLTTKDRAEAENCAAHLEELNASRKGAVASMVRQARKTVSIRYSEASRVVVLGNVEWKPALLGLAANSIMQERGGVVCIWGRDGQGSLKGSCRSDGSVSLVELFKNAGDALAEYGGHERSGGFSVSYERVHELPEIFAKAAAASSENATPAKPEADVRITLPEISWHTFQEVSQLAPFGVDNRKPMFLIEGSTVAAMKRFGKEQNHVEISLTCQNSNAKFRAFDFFRSPDDFTHTPQIGGSARFLATPPC